jgi:caffeoyl-CoA O-methyltransferase
MPREEQHMSERDRERWAAVEDYLTTLFAPSDPALDAALVAASEAGMPMIQVTPTQGKVLHLLALACRARHLLEIGTLAGYSTIWLARALPAEGGLVVTLEANPTHAQVARSNLARAGVADRVEVRLGSALDSLAQLAADGQGPFDLVFIDADTLNLEAYFAWAVRLTRRGGLIITDNVVLEGNVLNAASSDPLVQAVRRFHTAVAAEPRVSATVIQTVGRKGYDGLALMTVI